MLTFLSERKWLTSESYVEIFFCTDQTINHLWCQNQCKNQCTNSPNNWKIPGFYMDPNTLSLCLGQEGHPLEDNQNFQLWWCLVKEGAAENSFFFSLLSQNQNILSGQSLFCPIWYLLPCQQSEPCRRISPSFSPKAQRYNQHALCQFQKGFTSWLCVWTPQFDFSWFCSSLSFYLFIYIFLLSIAGSPIQSLRPLATCCTRACWDLSSRQIEWTSSQDSVFLSTFQHAKRA